MLTRFRSAASARAEDEDVLSPLAGCASKVVHVICQVMTGKLRGEVRAELKLVREDVNELCINTKKVFGKVYVRLDTTKNTMPPAVVLDEVAQLQTDVSVVMVGRNAVSIES